MISVVIPTFKRSDTIVGLLEDLTRQTGGRHEVIVVDDCSPDDPSAWLQRRFPGITVLRNEVNSGPAVTRNRGIRAAHGDIIVGFDNDVRVPGAGTLDAIAGIFARRPEIDGLAFRVLTPDGASDDVDRWWHPVPVGEFAHQSFLTSYFSGTAYAFRRAALIGTGLFPEVLFMHYEEVELAYRLLDRGSLLLYCPEIRVLHFAHPVSRRSEIKAFYKPRNQVLLAIGCLPLARAFAYIAPRLAYQFLVALRDGHVPSFVRALASAFRRLPGRWRERRVLSPATLRRIALLRTGVTTGALAA